MLSPDPTLINFITVNLAVVDDRGDILAVNDAWRRFGRENGLLDERGAVGENYVDVCIRSGVPRDGLEDLRDVLAGRRTVLSRWYPCHGPLKKRWFFMIAMSDRSAKRTTLCHMEITDLIPSETADRLDLEFPEGSSGESGDMRLERLLSRLAPPGKADVTEEPRIPDEIQRQARRAFQVLTKRQYEVLLHLGRGYSNAEIARELCASPNTIKLHVSAIMKRLGITSRAQAVVLATQIRTIHPPGD